ncbi:MAG: hypothetical protein CMP07_14650 [Xanthomonadales bacterium]|nr:hypothetical protein [Xanthomonadales bacterium]|tara:strand:- start:249 stop:1058 length:810 start_codon:yes stop_codon:yes gene_type:complete
MSFRLGSFFQTNAHSTLRRVYFAVVRRLSGVFSKRQAVYFVEINGTRFKRVVLGDSYEACLVERALESAPASARFPQLIHRHENELLLSFVEGRKFDPARAADLGALAAFFGALYGADRRGESSRNLWRALNIDLDFLATAGLIDPGLKASLLERAGQLRPVDIQVGLDYVDPVAKNFVMDGDSIVAIDVESLRRDVPLGTGIAKAGVHWLGREAMGDFIESVSDASDFTLGGQQPFVDLCFRVGWTKRKLLQGKHRSVRIELLREVVE